MGAWGYALFSDDTALDVRSDYRELIEDGVEDGEATQKILAQYAEILDDPDEGPVVWLALAAAQSKIGRLDAAVLTEALEILDRGIGLDL
ncbi:MAG: MarR family transcriptional regulator [Thermoactinospora sp.]|nr:MarR family transcriptional regulator [Thermoactinospora sp.]